MDKNVRCYKQRGDTCAIACMMMVLEYYNIMSKANWYDEKRLYRLYGSKYINGTPFSALAYHLSKKGLETTLFHSDENFFNNNYNALSDDDFKFAMEEYKQNLTLAEKTGTQVFNGVDINVDLLKKKLQDGNLIILAGENSGYYHAILLSGYEKNSFIVCDPLYKNKQIRTFEEIQKFMDTSIGKWFISINDDTIEKKNIINSLDNFNSEANEFMLKKEGKCLYREKK